jgi:large subunit ribosomal protein L21
MPKYAVIRTGGKQYKVSEGQQIKIERINTKAKTVDFTDVLLTVDGEKVEVGTPTLPVKVTASVVGQTKSEKVNVFKYKAKTGYHKKIGHRQNLTVVKIEKIEKKG